MTTFNNIIEEKVGESFPEFRIRPSLVSILTYAFPKAVAYYLNQSMYDKAVNADKNEPAESFEESITFTDGTNDLMSIGLTATKKGDSVAFMPTFEMLPAGTEIILQDDYKASNKVLIDSLVGTPNSKFITFMAEVLKGSMLENNEWIENPNMQSDDSGNKGMEFSDETDLQFVINAIVLSIFEVLCNNKDSSADVTYEVPLLGTFTISPTKNSYKVELSFAKEFKQDCKSDTLSETISNCIAG